ncbi:MAG: HEAT repeat domain-containing protein [Ignavibacteria bacterium]|jgi:hypothetical protein
MKRLFFSQLFLFLVYNSLFAEIKIINPATKYPSSFAIVIDKITFEKVENAVLAYRDAVENEDALSVFILVVDSELPTAIKEELINLYNSSPKLKGAVFVGDIPIPMLRGAQHMTSAFKMHEEKYDWIQSSVPSDRFYDDFDLQFDYLKQDSTNGLLYYYKLKHDSPQTIQKDIYSGRIKAPVNDDSKYELIKTYLAKVVAAKKQPEVLDNAFVFTGDGNRSDALTAWSDELIALREQFPQLFSVGGKLKQIRFSMSPTMKEILMAEMSVNELDMAVFHAHGAEETQYLIDYPPAESFRENIAGIKRFLRSKLRYDKRHGKDVEEVKEHYKEKYNLTDEWFYGAFEDSVVAADSLYEYEMNIHSEDLAKFSPQPEFIMFDQCFNGSFQVENYISGRYVFGTGNVISSVANSVNVLQDNWGLKSIGLLGYGVSVGNWHQEVNYLENHIIGDPTFHFKSNIKIELNKKIAEESDNEKLWRSLLDSPEAELRSLAVVKLYKILGDDFISELVNIYKTDISYNVRAHALYSLAATRSKEFEEILFLSIKDPYELIRSISAKLMGNIGSDKYIHEMVYNMIFDEDKRVSFNLEQALALVDKDKLMEEADNVVSKLPNLVDKESLINFFKINIVKHISVWLIEDIIPRIQNDTLDISKRISNVRLFRNSTSIESVPILISILEDKGAPDELRIVLAETLGWYYYSEKRDEIINAINKIINDNNTPESLLKEAVKTRNRLTSGCNVPIAT